MPQPTKLIQPRTAKHTPARARNSVCTTSLFFLFSDVRIISSSFFSQPEFVAKLITKFFAVGVAEHEPEHEPVDKPEHEPER